MYGYGYKINSGLVVGSGGGGAPFTNTYSLDFDGVDDKVEIGTQSLGITGAISVSAWVKIPTANTGGASPFIQVIFGEETRYNPNRNWALFWRGGTNLNGFSAFIYDSSGAYVSVNSATPTPNDNQWHHLMFTYTGDTTTNGLKLFVDGVQIAQATSANGGLRASSTVIPTIGGVSNSTQRMFEGSIDEASIFNSVVDIADVWDGSGNPTDLTSLSPVGWYRMGDNGAYKSPQFLLPNNENFAANKVSNYSFELDGIDDYIDLGNDSSLDIFGSDFTISLWAKWGAQTSNSNGLINFAGNTNKAVITLGFGTQYGKISFGTGSSSTVGILYDCGSGYNDNSWHHIMCTLEGSTRTIYVDGVDISSTGSVSSIGVGSNNDIGNRARSRYFVGNIDEVSIFDSVIPIGDVWDGSGQPTTISGAVAHYKMGEEATFSGGVWTVPDNVGTNNGTSNAMTIEDRVGEAPNSTSNSVSYNMDEVDRVEDTP